MSKSKTMNFEQKKQISLYSIGINLTLSILKIIGGTLSGSAALTADGVHSLSDLAASLSVYAGIIISNKKSDAFPLGLYKVENLVALVSAFAIFFAGYEIAKDVFFGEAMMIKNIWIAIGVIGLTVLITYLYSRWEKKMAIELNSPSLLADAEHIKTDFYTALVVLVGVLGQYFGYPIVEKLAVAVVVYFIFHSGFEILKDAIKVLLDASVDADTIDNIRDLLKHETMIDHVNRITGRNAGSFKFIQLDLDVKTDSLKEAHAYAHQLEAKIKKEMPFVERVIVHFE
jgi:cation diffusion facilitator family transporter